MNTKHKFQNKEGSKELYSEISEYINNLVATKLDTIISRCLFEFTKQYHDMVSEIISDTNHCCDNKFEHIRNIISIYVVQEVIQVLVEETTIYDRTWLQTNYNEYAVVQWENMDPVVLDLIIDRLLYTQPTFLRQILTKMV